MLFFGKKRRQEFLLPYKTLIQKAMKHSSLLFLLMGLPLFFSACNDSPSAEKAKENIQNATEKVENAVHQTVDDVKEKVDEHFVSKTLKDNAKELEWLRAGAKMGTDAELMGIAKKMIPDHEKIAEELRAYASKKNISLNVDTSKGIKIDSKTGADWDEDWADKIRDMQRDMIAKFEHEQSDSKDLELRELATKTLPMLRTHLNWAEKVEMRLHKATGK